MGKMFMCVREGRRQTLGPYARPASVDRTGGGSHSPPSRIPILFVYLFSAELRVFPCNERPVPGGNFGIKKS